QAREQAAQAREAAAQAREQAAQARGARAGVQVNVNVGAGSNP
ncbi:MAG: EF-hand domain-containing protein, partial [Myxococcales bacterium]|nr:EF-hand domain-containing protein [Myxococcales bacterium]